MKFNEEQIKNNLVLPLLQETGIAAGELEFESNFTIRLGRGVFTVDGQETQKATGRSDILCKRDNRPLFLIELKAEGEHLTDEDKNQGLSYARLLDEIAPYLILSNGEQTFIYDVLTGAPVEQIRPEATLHGLAPNLDSELALRFEALKQFVGYSYTNLLSFCQAHNKEALEKFSATPSENVNAQIQKKYIPQTYVQRDSLETCFKGFLEQDDRCLFAIIGQSGVGKTNTMCYLVETYDFEPCLFYSASLMGNSFLKELCSDFNLSFSSQESDVSLFKKISACTERHDKSFAIFLDAIDEWEAPDKIQQLQSVIKLLKHLGFRLIVSCKTQVWQTFLSRNGIPTELSDCLYPEIPELSDFDNQESKEAITKYEALLGIVRIDPTRPAGIMNPFALRISCEVAFRDKIPLDLTEDSRVTLKRYLTLKFEKSSNSDLCLRFLRSIGRSLLAHDQVQLSDEILRAELSLRLQDDFPFDLFNLNILYKYFDESLRISIGFYFSVIRDYIVAIDVLQLDNIEGTKRIQTLADNLSTYIGENAFIYFFRTGNTNEQISCIEAAIEYDTKNNKAVLARLLAWHGHNLSDEARAQLGNRVLDHFKLAFEEHRDDGTVADQILDSIEALGELNNTEQLLAEFFSQLIQFPEAHFTTVSHRLAQMLSKGNDASVTDLLISLLPAKPETGYVRRYIVETLGYRSVPDRKKLLLKLVVDSDSDVRVWLRRWYRSTEDRDLRDALLKILDESKTSRSIKKDLAQTLGLSILSDTGRELHRRLVTYESDQTLSSWIIRSIADLNYRPAIPEFIKMLKASPYSERAGHLLIALGDMHAVEGISTLFDILKCTDQSIDSTWPHWFVYAFKGIATKDDYEKLESIASKNENSNVRFLATLILASTGNQSYASVIIRYVTDESVPVSRRTTLFQDWAHTLIGFVTSNGMRRRTTDTPNVSSDILATLYEILEQNNQMSTIALGSLISLEPNAKKLYLKITEVLPTLAEHYSAREIMIVSRRRLEDLGYLIRPWLNNQIGSKQILEGFIRNCFTFVNLVGDVTTIETINTNRSTLEAVLGKDYLGHIEHIIRKSRGEVRLRPH